MVEKLFFLYVVTLTQIPIEVNCRGLMYCNRTSDSISRLV